MAQSRSQFRVTKDIAAQVLDASYRVISW